MFRSKKNRTALFIGVATLILVTGFPAAMSTVRAARPEIDSRARTFSIGRPAYLRARALNVV